jgi:DNA repair exonuclease SbcCD ATPase subunit
MLKIQRKLTVALGICLALHPLQTLSVKATPLTFQGTVSTEEERLKQELERLKQELATLQQQALIAAEQEKIAKSEKAIFDNRFPQTAISDVPTGKTTFSGDAPSIESITLAYESVDEIARAIKTRFQKDPNLKGKIDTLIIYREQEISSLLAYQAFLLQVKELEDNYKKVGNPGVGVDIFPAVAAPLAASSFLSAVG